MNADQSILLLKNIILKLHSWTASSERTPPEVKTKYMHCILCNKEFVFVFYLPVGRIETKCIFQFCENVKIMRKLVNFRIISFREYFSRTRSEIFVRFSRKFLRKLKFRERFRENEKSHKIWHCYRMHSACDVIFFLHSITFWEDQ
jgi:hypothetical protein